MPRTPIDYAKTTIYKLVHKDDLNDENIYTGHTTNFICRKNKHKSDCNNPNSLEYNTKKYKYIRENGGWDEWCMIEIEKYSCKDVYEARARERQIQTNMNAKLNTDIAGRTIKEWWFDNPIKRKEYYDRYNFKNKEKRNELEKQRYIKKKDEINKIRHEKITCDICGSMTTKNHKARHQKSNRCINFNLDK